jgi:hypothetical protein
VAEKAGLVYRRYSQRDDFRSVGFGILRMGSQTTTQKFRESRPGFGIQTHGEIRVRLNAPGGKHQEVPACGKPALGFPDAGDIRPSVTVDNNAIPADARHEIEQFSLAYQYPKVFGADHGQAGQAVSNPRMVGGKYPARSGGVSSGLSGLKENAQCRIRYKA